MIAFLLSIALVQAPAPKTSGVVVLIVQQQRLSYLEADGLAERVAAALSAAKVPILMSPTDVQDHIGRAASLKCIGKPLCIAELGRELGAAAAVGVEAAAFFGQLGIKLTVITTDGTAPVFDDSVVVDPKNTAEIDSSLAGLAERVHAALSVFPAFAPPKPPVVVKPPDVPRVEPVLPPNALVPAPALPPKGGGPPAMAYVAGGGALASAAAAGVFGFLAYQTYRDSTPTASARYPPYQESGVSLSDYQAMQRNAVVSAVAGGACVALSSLAIYLFVQGSPPAR